MGKFVKVIGVKFDAFNGLRIVADYNRKDLVDAGFVANQIDDGDTIFVCIPCTYEIEGVL